MEKIERIFERYKTYLGVKDVKLVVRPYKTRTVFLIWQTESYISTNT